MYLNEIINKKFCWGIFVMAYFESVILELTIE